MYATRVRDCIRAARNMRRSMCRPILRLLLAIMVVTVSCENRDRKQQIAGIAPELQVFTLHKRNTCLVVSGGKSFWWGKIYYREYAQPGY